MEVGKDVERGGLFRWVCMCGVAYILQKWKDMCNVDTLLNWDDICNNADISKLYAIQLFNMELKWGEG